MRKSTKRTVAIALPVAVLGVAGVAYAASLSTTSTDLGAGGTDVSSCATDAAVSFKEEFVPAAGAVAPHYRVSEIKIVMTDDPVAASTTRTAATDCDASNYKVAVTSASGSVLEQEYLSGTGAPVITGGILTLPVSAVDNIKAADVTGVYVVTEG